VEFKGRRTDDWGNVIFEAEGLVDLLMRGSELSEDLLALDSDGVSRFNRLCRELDHPEDAVTIYSPPTVSVEQWDEEHQNRWFIPEPYASMNVLDWLVERCQGDDQLIRISEEWVEFEQRGMIPVLQALIYLVESFRERNILWGVGRGSSVASYILFKIGVHRVDSMAYDLDIGEFLK
jgi:hypothetical protein